MPKARSFLLPLLIVAAAALLGGATTHAADWPAEAFTPRQQLPQVLSEAVPRIGGGLAGRESGARDTPANVLEDVLADSDVIAWYGHPDSRHMGILGEYPLPVVSRRVAELARTYDEVNGPRRVVPAFHIIFGTAHPSGAVGTIDEERLAEYLDHARREGILVVLDHQLGSGDAEAAVREMLPYLRHDNVHLAIDPEWSTDTPGQELGSVTADEVNRAQRAIQEYLVEHDIAQRKMLVIHQFSRKMIERRDAIRSDFPRVAVVHNMDGFGPPERKRGTWRFNLRAQNMPLKGFKLFYPKPWHRRALDDPMLEPEDVMALEPRPVFIQYQ